MADILKEAIAEAKIVRDIAYENARQTLTEAFEPKIKNMISTTLKNESDDDSEDVGVDDIPKDEDTQVETEETEETESDTTEDTEASVNEDDMTDDTESETNDEEFESVLKELEDELDDTSTETNEDDMTDDTKSETNVTEEDDEYHTASETDVTEEDTSTETDDDNFTAEDLDSVLDNDDEKDTSVQTAEIKKLKTENKKLRKSVLEHAKAVKFLKNELSEINLLNSKLLHTTKIFRRFNLKNEEKTKVVNTFDRTKSIREVKLVYATIVESLDLKPNNKRRLVNALQENSSTSIGSTKPSKEDVVVENVDFKSRLQKLAGIIK